MKNTTPWIFLLFALFFSLTILADDEPKQVKRKHFEINPILKELVKKISKRIDGDDTLVFDKTTEDTLIFADDEKRRQEFSGQPNREDNPDFAVFSKKDKLPTINPVIYPNPSPGTSMLQLSGEENTTTQIIITTANGIVVKNDVFQGNAFELKDLVTGTYIITIKSKGETAQRRLFVK